MDEQKHNLLGKVNFPSDLKKLKLEELSVISEELRQFIIDILSNNSGHLGASLGVIELTVALHYVFNTPYDQIIWDVGHQAYAHKILTGRKDVFQTNRKYNGISGFPKINESVFDSFGVGQYINLYFCGFGYCCRISAEWRKGSPGSCNYRGWVPYRRSCI